MTAVENKPRGDSLARTAEAAGPQSNRAASRTGRDADVRDRWEGLTAAQAAVQAGSDITACLERCSEIYTTTPPRPSLSRGRACVRWLTMGSDILLKKACDPERRPSERLLYATMLAPTLLLAPILALPVGGEILSHRTRFEAEDKMDFAARHHRHDARRAIRRELDLLSRRLSGAPDLGGAVDDKLVDYVLFTRMFEISELKLRDPLRPIQQMVTNSLRKDEK